MKPFHTICILLLVAGSGTSAADWPHWRGAARTGLTQEDSGWETGAWKSPATLWSANVGVGGCSMVVFKGRLYTLGFNQGNDTLFCLDTKTGRELWRQSYPSRNYGRFARGDQGFYQGPLATPEMDVSTGRLYTLSVDGELMCWELNSTNGKISWRVNLYNQFNVPQRPQVTRRGGSHRDYGYTCAPLVHGKQVVVEVGDPKSGNLMGFDKLTGKLLWRSENRDPAGHTGGLSPITVDGVPCVAVLTALNLVVARLDEGNEGRTVGEYSWVTDFINNIPTPAVSGQDVMVTSKYNRMAMARLHVTLKGIQKVWEKPMASGVCSLIIDDDKVYWANRGMYCVDFDDGRFRWRGGQFQDAASCILTRDKRLIVWADRGDLTLVQSALQAPASYAELARHSGVLRDTAWPHIVLADGQLYCKDRSGRIKCLALGKGFVVPGSDATKPIPSVTNRPSGKRQPFDLLHWLSDARALVLGWQQGGGKRNLKGSLLKDERCRFETRGTADFGPDREMKMNGGAFLLKGGDNLHLRFKESGQFTLETILTCDRDVQRGPARIVSLSESAYRRNFTLGQEGDQFVFRLRTTQSDENGTRPEVRFGKVRSGEQVHLVVTYRDGELICYQNGSVVFAKKNFVRGTLDNWTAQHLLIGDEWDGKRTWTGRVFGVALLNRFLSAEEIGTRYRTISE